MNSSINVSLEKASWQDVLFCPQPKRLELVKLDAVWPLKEINCRVHRNHAFEHVASVAAAWSSWWDVHFQFSYSDYDDSLSFQVSDDGNIDVEILWIDYERYQEKFSEPEWISWFVKRIEYLRKKSNSPILVIPSFVSEDGFKNLKDECELMPGIRVADSLPVSSKLGPRFKDLRAAKFTGTSLSDQSNIHIARWFACKWLPALLFPRIKAIAVDLDQTLYQGVLGEDGLEVELTSAHKQLQELLVSLKKEGIFLALISRNEQVDVEKLFKERKDFPLQWDDFSSKQISWGSKADALSAIAKQLKIGDDAILFVDDNPGELMAVTEKHPEVRIVHAKADAEITSLSLEFFPGLWAWEKTNTDLLRHKDILADEQRSHMAQSSSDIHEYLASLDVTLTFYKSNRDHQQRVFELSNKTNQFNLNFQRYTEVQIDEIFESHCVITFNLEDKLSDSGLIGLVIGEKNEGTIVISELCVSCRALGRQLEDGMLTAAFRLLQNHFKIESVLIDYKTGERNQPAIKWLKKYFDNDLQEQGRVAISSSIKEHSQKELPIKILYDF